ncbi:hypothetical protein KJY78_03185 [Canibacter sp. lx-45]|uniref:DUF6049 family protein n=1 Tax=Canibacter zhuwentaonis TaxID=2837491 RepID=UPI001BDC130C|nr:DUF6049 family protein [Canibacter zhuwentaonis]MBT1035357.1 hypothetical protein [Canibacter zhuwentaonis]
MKKLRLISSTALSCALLLNIFGAAISPPTLVKNAQNTQASTNSHAKTAQNKPADATGHAQNQPNTQVRTSNLTNAQADTSNRANPLARAQTNTTQNSEAIVTLSPDTPQKHTASEVAFTVYIKNRGEQTLPVGTVKLFMRPEAVLDPDLLNRGVGENPLLLKTIGIDALEPDAQTRQTVTVPVEQLAQLGITDATTLGGATYLFQAVFSPGGSAAKPTTSAQTLPADNYSTTTVTFGNPTTNAQLGIIVPLLLPETTETIPSLAETAEIFRVTGPLSQLLYAAEALDATLAIDPRILIALRCYGANTPPVAREFLDRLETSPLPSFLLQYADADLGLQAKIKVPSPLASPGASFTGSPSFNNTAPAPEPAHNSDFLSNLVAGADLGQNLKPAKVPSIEKLTAWQNTAIPNISNTAIDASARTAWLDSATTNNETLQFLANHGYKNIFLADSSITEPNSQSGGEDSSQNNSADSTNGVSVAELSQFNATLLNGALTDAAQRAATGTAEQRAHALARIINELAIRAKSFGHTIFALDRSGAADGTETVNLLHQLAILEHVEFVRANQGTGRAETAQPHFTQQLQPASSHQQNNTKLKNLELRAASATRALNQEAAILRGSTILTDPQYLSHYQRARILNLMSAKYAQHTNYKSVATTFQNYNNQLSSSVTVVSATHTYLFGSSTNLPVQLHNNLPFGARIRIHATAGSPAIALQGEKVQEKYLAPGQTSTVIVPLQSRITHADSSIVLNITDVTEKHTLHTATIRLFISSTVETFGIIIFSLIAASLIVFGVYRSVRRRRARVSQAADQSHAQRKRTT